MTKPTVPMAWIPDNTTNITDPSSLKTDGFTSDDYVNANYNNWLFNIVSQWINYMDQTHEVIYYVNSTKDDSNNGRTASTAFKTLDKALQIIEANGSSSAIIYLMDHAATFYVSNNHVFTNCNVRILATDPDAVIVFNAYSESGYQYHAKITLIDSNLQIECDTIGMASCTNGAESWGSYAAAILFSGNSTANIKAYSYLTFNNTVVAAGGTRSFAANSAAGTIPSGNGVLTVFGTIIYGSLDYLFDVNHMVATLSLSTNTDPTKWVLNGVAQDNPDNKFVAAIKNGITPVTSVTLFAPTSSAYISEVLDVTWADATIITAIKNFITTAFPVIAAGDVTGSLLRNGTTTILGVRITISGASARLKLNENITILVAAGIYQHMTISQAPRQVNMNVLCNLPNECHYQ